MPTAQARCRTHIVGWYCGRRARGSASASAGEDSGSRVCACSAHGRIGRRRIVECHGFGRNDLEDGDRLGHGGC